MQALTTLRLLKIREQIIETLTPILSASGDKIKIRSGENKFLRIYNDGFSQIQFFYDNYFPIDYKVYFIYCIYQKEIPTVIKSFNVEYSIQADDTPNIGFAEADFISDLRNKSFKERIHYKNSIRHYKDLESLIEKYRELINELVLELDGIFSTLRGTNEYLKKERKIILETPSTSMLQTSLISSKILKDPEYADLFNHYQQELSGVTNPSVFVERTIQTLNNLNNFLDRHPL